MLGPFRPVNEPLQLLRANKYLYTVGSFTTIQQLKETAATTQTLTL